jgi:putative acetyltransferase
MCFPRFDPSLVITAGHALLQKTPYILLSINDRRAEVMSKILIQKADKTDSRLLDIIKTHHDYTLSHTPACSGHAVSVETVSDTSLTYWLALEDDIAVGCIALKERIDHIGEIKTMHTLEAHRGKGIARLLMETVEKEARSRAMSELVLETGKSDEFGPSRKFYTNYGFQHCAPFDEYIGDDFSYCMRKSL